MARPLRQASVGLTADELLDASPWWAALSRASRDRIRDTLVERALASGEVLSGHGEPPRHWYGVMAGMLKWSISAPDGRTVSLGVQSAGSWFGEGTLLREQPRQSDLIALIPARVALVPAEVFREVRAGEPALDAFLIGQLNERMHWFMGNYAARGLLDTDGLVARALVGLAHPLLAPRHDGRIGISQEELANLSTVSRQRCNAALMRLKEAGLLRQEYGTIVIHDLAALRRLAG